MPTELKNLVLNEVSAIVEDGEPANRLSTVQLLKTRGGDMNEEEKTTILRKIAKALGFADSEADKLVPEEENLVDENAVTKKLEALETKVEKLESEKRQLEMAAKISKAEKPEDLDTISKELGDQDTDLKKAVSDRREELKKAVDVEKMREKHKAFREKLPKAMQKAFDDMEDDERERMMSKFGKAEDADPVGKMLDSVSKKNEELEKKNESLEKSVNEMKDAEAIRKIAADEFKGIEGAEGLAKSVHELRKSGHEDEAKVFIDKTKQLQGMVNEAKMFGVFGSDHSVSKAEDKIDKLAKARAEKDGITKEQAYDLVTQENPDLYTESLNEKEG